MIQKVNKIYKPLFTEDSRYFFLMGGRGRGGSYVGSQYALVNLTAEDYFRCAIMRQIYKDIRHSMFQEIKDRIDEQELDAIKTKENTMTFEYGDNMIDAKGFRKSSSDQSAKLKSLANYNTVIIEEADEIDEEDFDQLDDSLRTNKGDIKIIFILNPPSKNHWIIKRWFNLVESDIDGFFIPKLKESEKHNTTYIHSTYRDNIENLNDSSIVKYKRYKKTNPDHYHNMIQGLVSEGSRGRIYKGWQPIPDEEYEKLPYKPIYALDFGFSNDPTALDELKMHNEKVWAKELIHSTGMTNKMISDRMEQLGIDKRNAIIYADNAEPKSIEELSRMGWNILPCKKGKGSISAGIDMLQDKQICYTESSENIAEEVQEYKWALDRHKNPTNKPVDDFNHHMDAIRYGVYTKESQGFVGFV